MVNPATTVTRPEKLSASPIKPRLSVIKDLNSPNLRSLAETVIKSFKNTSSINSEFKHGDITCKVSRGEGANSPISIKTATSDEVIKLVNLDFRTETKIKKTADGFNFNFRKIPKDGQPVDPSETMVKKASNLAELEDIVVGTLLGLERIPQVSEVKELLKTWWIEKNCSQTCSDGSVIIPP